jgi:hypothetical protein
VAAVNAALGADFDASNHLTGVVAEVVPANPNRKA